MLEKVEFTMMPDGRILDLRPMYENKPPFVYENGTWVVFKGPSSEVVQSKPLNLSDIRALTSNSSLLH